METEQNGTKIEPFPWTKTSEKAAVLVAAGELTEQRIADQLKIGRTTLYTWRQHPGFRAKVLSHLKAIEDAFLQVGIASKVNRVQRKDKTRQELLQIVEARAAHARKLKKQRDDLEAVSRSRGATDDQIERLAREERWPFVYPGEEFGHSIRTDKVSGRTYWTEVMTDTGLLAQIDRLENDTAKELGQITDRLENREYDMSEFDEAELERIVAGEPIERVFASSRRRRAGAQPQAAGEDR